MKSETQTKGKDRRYDYLIVGGGMTASAAIEGIRSVDSHGTIGLFSFESDAPYDRPPLSKALWKGKPVDSIWRKVAEHNVSIHLGCPVTDIDSTKKEATDSQGNAHSWNKLLLATGGSPRRLPFGGAQIIYYRTLADYRRLRSSMENAERYAVIGGGFIGSEIAAALAMNGKRVTMLFPGSGISHHVFPKDLSQFLYAYYQEKGVRMFAGTRITDLQTRGTEIVVKTNTQQELQFDVVIAGIGIEPNVDLARRAGVAVENGVIVDEFLRAGRPDIFAAGDVAAFNSPSLGKRIRVEHEDNANTMGRNAGRNMAGQKEPYRHLPFFYSDLFQLGYEAVGELDPRLETEADWKEPFREGVVYYLKDGRVRGVLLWNTWGQVDNARALIGHAGHLMAG